MTYQDILARTARKRPDGSPVWPLTDADVPSRINRLDYEDARVEAVERVGAGR